MAARVTGPRRTRGLASRRSRLAVLVALVATAVVGGVVPGPGATAVAADDLIEVNIAIAAPDPFSAPGFAPASAGLVGGAADMTGELVLALHPPGGTPCQNAPVATANRTVVNGQASVTLTHQIRRGDPAGTWYWRATYAGDAQHAAASACRPMFVVQGDPWDDGPFGSVENLVVRQYNDLLDRDPTATELADWAGRIQADEATPGELVAALRASDDHRTHVDPVVRLYRAYYLRTPDVSGLQYWLAQSRSGRSLESISEFFSQSPEFANRYGSLGNAAFVDLVYQNVLDRAGDQNGVAFWNSELDRGLRTRGRVMIGFSESPEYVADQASAVSVSVLFALMMGRLPGDLEFSTLVDLLEVGPTAPLPFTLADLADELLGRSDYPV